MYSKIAVNALLIFILAAFQLSFISGLPAFFSSLNLILVALVFILGLFGLDIALVWAIGLGFLSDIFSFSPFGLHIVCLPAAVMLVDYLLVRFFTDKSLYSFLALTAAATVIYEILLNGLWLAVNTISGEGMEFVFNKFFWQSKASLIALNLFASFVVFYFIGFISQKFKPVFLIKHK